MSLVSRIVLRIHVFETQRTNGRYLSDVLAGLCPVKVPCRRQGQPLHQNSTSRDCGALHKAAHALIAVVTHAEVKPNLVGLRTGRECLDCPERIRTRKRLSVAGLSRRPSSALVLGGRPSLLSRWAILVAAERDHSPQF